MLWSILTERGLKLPESPQEALLLALILLAIAIVMTRRAGPAFALAATLAGLAAYLLDQHVYLPFAILLAGLLARPPDDVGRRRSWSEVWGEIGLVGLGFMLYEIGRAESEGSAEAAYGNADRLIALERALRLPSEASAQQLILAHAWLIELFNFIYSYMFLIVVVAVLFWLFVNSPPVYRLYRTSLGWSAMLTVALSAAVPVAPPRLLSRTGLLDTQVLVGAQHGFANQYAALPSLHVGWSVLAGAMLVRAIGGRRGWLLGIIPGTVIAATVVVTGHHFWLDGVAGIVICLTPVAFILYAKRWADALGRRRAALRPVGQAVVETLRARRAVLLSVLALSGILAYLLVGQIVAPGFTDHWGYFPPQISFYLAVAIVGETMFRREGGLFGAPTLAVAVAAVCADVFGTSDDLYATYSAYDKIVHFLGTAALTAVMIDILVALAARGRIDRPQRQLLTIGVVLGIGAGITWEIYEFLGDNVFNSARTGGRVDTSYDILFDTLGALLMGLIAALRIWPVAWRTALPEARLVDPHPYLDAGSPDSQSS